MGNCREKPSQYNDKDMSRLEYYAYVPETGQALRTKPLIDLPSNSQSPLSVHINRNGFRESLHEVDVAVCDADGSVILGMGDVESVIFPRSAMKPLQSLF